MNTLCSDVMSEEDLRKIMSHCGWSDSEIATEVEYLGGEKIIAALYGQGDLREFGGWDHMLVEAILNEAARRNFPVTGYMERI